LRKPKSSQNFSNLAEIGLPLEFETRLLALGFVLVIPPILVLQRKRERQATIRQSEANTAMVSPTTCAPIPFPENCGSSSIQSTFDEMNFARIRPGRSPLSSAHGQAPEFGGEGVEGESGTALALIMDSELLSKSLGQPSL